MSTIKFTEEKLEMVAIAMYYISIKMSCLPFVVFGR